MTIKEALGFGSKKLESEKIESPLTEAEILLSFAIKKNKEFLLTYPEKKLSFLTLFLFKKLIKKRILGYSIAVIVGYKWFYESMFEVNKNTLIPRPETELLVEEVVKMTKKRKSETINIVDIGTGSGCIIISLVKILNDEKIKYYGIDISKKALKVAIKNAKKQKVLNCITFLHNNLLNSVNDEIIKGPTIITANLPYLTPEQIKNSPSIQKEPKIALESGVDGLRHYHLLFKQIKEKMVNNKEAIVVFCEIDNSQGETFPKIILKELPSAKTYIKKDINGDNQLAIVCLL